MIVGSSVGLAMARGQLQDDRARPFTRPRQLAIRRAGHSRIQDRYLLDQWAPATAEIKTHYRRPFREPATLRFVWFDFARNPVLDAAVRVAVAAKEVGPLPQQAQPQMPSPTASRKAFTSG